MMEISKRILESRKSNLMMPGIKVNLYRDFEFASLAKVVKNGRARAVECVMIGESFYMTHGGRDTTSLTIDQQRMAMSELPDLVREVAEERNRQCLGDLSIMADIPDLDSKEDILTIIKSYASSGAEIVKFEYASDEDFWVTDAIHEAGMEAARVIVKSGVQKSQATLCDCSVSSVTRSPSLNFTPRMTSANNR